MISGNELRNPHPIGSKYRLGDEISGSEISEESHFRCPPQSRFDEVGDFGDDELRNQQRTRMRFQEPQTLLVVVIIFVDVGVQRSGVDDQRDRRASSRMISSTRRAVSREPLRADFAAISFRRTPRPRWLSRACRVTSATVLRLRAAS